MALNIADAEKRVLSAVIARNEMLDIFAEILRVDDFSDEPYQLIWTGLQTLRRARQPLNVHTLGEQLSGYREQITDELLRDLAIASSLHAREALADGRMVLRDALRRRLVTFGQPDLEGE